VKRAIWAANQLRHKKYRYGGGHKSFDDRGYDCSGTISYVLGAGGLISAPMSSTEFRNYGDRGPGKWITIYAREGHTFAVIAGQRLDTTPYDRYRGKWAPRWQTIIVRRAGLTQDIRSACSRKLQISSSKAISNHQASRSDSLAAVSLKLESWAAVAL